MLIISANTPLLKNIKLQLVITITFELLPYLEVKYTSIFSKPILLVLFRIIAKGKILYHACTPAQPT